MILEKIRELCKQKKITPCELEKILGFGNGTIGRWNKSQPSIDKAMKVAKYFNVSLDYLSGFEKILPSAEAINLANTYDNLTEEEKNLVKCYISIIRKEKNV